MENRPYFTNDAIVLGILTTVLALIFTTERSPNPIFQKFYKFVPALVLCYFLPALLTYFNVISGESSKLYFVSSRYLLPAALVLLCIGIDLKGVLNLGWRAMVMFLAGTVSVIVGGPISLWAMHAFFPEVVAQAGGQDLWRGMATIAGSWIGGGANQAAMKEIYQASDNLFAAMVVVDVFVANIWMGIVLYGASISDKIDHWLKADNSAIESLKADLTHYQKQVAKNPTTTDYFQILAAAFGATALSHWGADLIAPYMQTHIATLSEWRLTTLTDGFFWLIVLATTIGVLYSFSPIRKLEGAGASKVGSIFIYILVASIGMKMDLGEVAKNWGVVSLGLIWMSVHILMLLLTAYLIRAPFFFVAVGSQANIGGAASAPVVASAFHPSLAPVGALLAVLGYALGTYGALICAQMMQEIVK
jgi:uncharacterized membrane protein